MLQDPSLKLRCFGILIGTVLILFQLIVSSGLAETKGDAKAGKVIYDRNCASCHGKKGEGVGFLSALPSLSDAKYMAGKTDAELLDKTANGGRGTGMPAWKNVLSEQDQWNVLLYIRTLSAP